MPRVLSEALEQAVNDDFDVYSYARIGTCLEIDDGIYRVRGKKRWWAVDPSARCCECPQYREVLAKDGVDCSHLRSLASFLESLGDPTLPPPEIRQCNKCGRDMNVTGVPRKSASYLQCNRGRWLQAAERKRRIANKTWAASGEHWNTSKALASPTTAELYWAAGFMEGEACFSGGKNKRNYTCRITVAQVNPEPLHRLRMSFGGKVSLTKRRKDFKPTWSDQYRWQITGARARGVQMTLFGLLSKRRQDQIKIEWGRCVPDYDASPTETARQNGQA